MTSTGWFKKFTFFLEQFTKGINFTMDDQSMKEPLDDVEPMDIRDEDEDRMDR